jgi:hypothetical protein
VRGVLRTLRCRRRREAAQVFDEDAIKERDRRLGLTAKLSNGIPALPPLRAEIWLAPN